MSDARDDDAEKGLRIRPYALTGGRTRSTHDLPIETIVRTSARGFVQQPRLTLERKRIVTLCAVLQSIAEATRGTVGESDETRCNCGESIR